jgi:hypothetical protein
MMLGCFIFYIMHFGSEHDRISDRAISQYLKSLLSILQCEFFANKLIIREVYSIKIFVHK